jgi:site-specific DNA-methyltransferase (cytosine-N4-specific)
MRQITLLPEILDNQEELIRDTFSHNNVCPEDARIALEEHYGELLEETEEFNRQLVSFQANKTETLHSWIKYREGFSASLVEIMSKKFGLEPGDTLLDPFAGSGTTLLVAQMLGINAVGIELLLHSHLAWKAKSRVFDYDLNELRTIRRLLEEITPPPIPKKFPHLTITRTAFPKQTEADLMAYTHWLNTLDVSEDAKLLCRLALTSILEDISYTRKDGQYLRWDRRAKKVRERNKKRVAKGKKPFKGIHKGPLPTVKEAFIQALNKIIYDIAELQRDPIPPSRQKLIEGNTLYVLPEMEPNQFAAVITSPPYANRYDYTRTYALELAYLGIGKEIFNLRQRQLSCTVENKPKLDELERHYQTIGHFDRYTRILNIIQDNEALAEVNAALRTRNKRGEINNRGVLSMIDQYFTELAFVFAELCRTCRPGANVAFVNDNVRYAGEVIPVDLLSTNLAEQVGFEPVKVYVLPQRKGNSSQQMGRFGREALRKSITIWRKPQQSTMESSNDIYNGGV